MTETVHPLVTFLNERIAEDENPTYKLVPYQCEPGCCAPAGYVGHECLICGDVTYGGTVKAITEIAVDHAESIHGRSRALAECAAKRAIIEWHQNWPVLAEYHRPAEKDEVLVDVDLSLTTLTMTREIAWLTNREYIARFGTEPPTAPILRIMVQVYADHPDFNPEWKL